MANTPESAGCYTRVGNVADNLGLTNIPGHPASPCTCIGRKVGSHKCDSSTQGVCRERAEPPNQKAPSHSGEHSTEEEKREVRSFNRWCNVIVLHEKLVSSFNIPNAIRRGRYTVFAIYMCKPVQQKHGIDPSLKACIRSLRKNRAPHLRQMCEDYGFAEARCQRYQQPTGPLPVETNGSLDDVVLVRSENSRPWTRTL